MWFQQVSQTTGAHHLPLQKMLRFFSAIFLASSIQRAEGADGGLKVQVTQKGLEYAKDFGLEMLTAFLKKEQMKNISGSYNVPLLGAVGYSVSGIQVKHLQVNRSTVGFSEGTGLNLTLQDARILLSSQWSLSSWLRGEEGSVDISMDRLFLSALLEVDKDGRGRPRVSYAGCHSALGHLELTFHRGNSWLYNLLAEALKGSLRTEVNKQLCSELKEGIGQLDLLLGAMNVSAQIDSFVGLDYSLVNKPSIGAHQCNVDLKGEFFEVRGIPKSPFLPAPYQLPSQSDSMVLLGISESFANSAAVAYFTAGRLRVNYTDETIPRNIPFRLNTKNLGVFIPELKKEFPDMDLEIHIAAQKPPVVSIRPGHLEAAVFASVEALVLLPNASLASAFLLNIDTNLTGRVSLQPVKGGKSIGKVVGSLALKSFHLSVERSSVGEIKVTLLEPVLKIAGQVALLSANRYLKKGVALPGANGLTVLNPKVTMDQGYLLVATDLWKEPERKRARRGLLALSRSQQLWRSRFLLA